jgi:hypothetical protein
VSDENLSGLSPNRWITSWIIAVSDVKLIIS